MQKAAYWCHMLPSFQVIMKGTLWMFHIVPFLKFFYIDFSWAAKLGKSTESSLLSSLSLRPHVKACSVLLIWCLDEDNSKSALAGGANSCLGAEWLTQGCQWLLWSSRHSRTLSWKWSKQMEWRQDVSFFFYPLFSGEGWWYGNRILVTVIRAFTVEAHKNSDSLSLMGLRAVERVQMWTHSATDRTGPKAAGSRHPVKGKSSLTWSLAHARTHARTLARYSCIHTGHQGWSSQVIHCCKYNTFLKENKINNGVLQHDTV